LFIMMASRSVCADARPPDTMPAIMMATASTLLTNIFISKNFMVKAFVLSHDIAFTRLIRYNLRY